jgi:hypothetical protein
VLLVDVFTMLVGFWLIHGKHVSLLAPLMLGGMPAFVWLAFADAAHWKVRSGIPLTLAISIAWLIAAMASLVLPGWLRLNDNDDFSHAAPNVSIPATAGGLNTNRSRAEVFPCLGVSGDVIILEVGSVAYGAAQMTFSSAANLCVYLSR